ncbi:MAG: hypothetical protein N0E40_09475 [Candidatus Thiodiazotropha taylori]|nr:hypothetical protein [Candidatus Thiodiazotropha taylori]MCW4304190.1 hypothetical protein [Candidatus Thiodiazotropha taylori]
MTFTMVLYGCESTALKTNIEHDNKLLMNSTVSWEEMSLSGAVYKQAHYRHVLALRKVKDLNSDGSIEKNVSDEKTLYEEEIWQIYCTDGRLNEYHWKTIARKGIGSMPKEMVNMCTPPGYTYNEYITAWNKYCEGNKLKRSERIIVDKTEYVCHRE